jgi:hypothetical protein
MKSGVNKYKRLLVTVLKGNVLVSTRLMKRWPFLLFISSLALISIMSSHRADKKVYEISRLNQRLSELRAHHIDLRASLMSVSKQTTVEEQVKDMGLHKADEPPVLITVE